MHFMTSSLNQNNNFSRCQPDPIHLHTCTVRHDHAPRQASVSVRLNFHVVMALHRALRSADPPGRSEKVKARRQRWTPKNINQRWNSTKSGNLSQHQNVRCKIVHHTQQLWNTAKVRLKCCHAGRGCCVLHTTTFLKFQQLGTSRLSHFEETFLHFGEIWWNKHKYGIQLWLLQVQFAWYMH